MSFLARFAEEADSEFVASSLSRSTRFQTAFARLIRSLGLERKQFGIDLLVEFQAENLRLDETERLEAKNDNIDCNSPAFRHLDTCLRYFCPLCSRQFSFATALTHLTTNEHMFRYTVFKYPREYERIDMLETFDDQLAAIKSLHERIAQKLNDFFNVEPHLVKVRNKDEEIKRYISRQPRRLYQFRPDIRAKLGESQKPPPVVVVVVKKQADEVDQKATDKSTKARLVSDTSMDDLSQINKKARPDAEEETTTTMAVEAKMSESMLLEEAEAEDEESGQLRELDMSATSNFDVLFDEENDDYGRYIERLNDRLASAVHTAGQLDEGFLLAFNEFFENLDIANDLDTLLKFKQVIEAKKSHDADDQE